MRIREICESATTSGSIATVVQPMGTVLKRQQPLAQLNKYSIKPRKPNVTRRFENSISN